MDKYEKLLVSHIADTNIHLTAEQAHEVEEAIKNIAAFGTPDLYVKVNYLESNYTKTSVLDATYVKATTADLKYATIETLNTQVAEIHALFSDYATITQLDVALANIDTLLTNYIKATDIVAENISVRKALLDAVKFNTAIGLSVTAQDVVSFTVTSDHLSIANGFITNAMINDLTATKITSGIINTTNVQMQSTSGRFAINDNTLQIKDSANTLRVQLGKDASNDYGIYVWDASANLMFDASGLTAKGITRKIIRNDVVADNANIDGSKLNITTVISSINADGSSTISTNKLNYNGSSFSSVFGDLTKLSTNLADEVHSNTSFITQNATSLTTIIQDYTDMGGTLGSKLSSFKQTYDGFVLSVSNTYATKTALDTTNANLTVASDKISWVVASGTSSTNFTITDRLASLVATKINIAGYVTFTDLLATSGTTIIDGSRIRTGSIDATALNIGVGLKGGYSVNPLWKKWNAGEALPVGTYRWGDSGRVDTAKITEYGETYLQLWNEQASLQIGVGLGSDFFVNPTSIQGVEYFGLEAKFRMTWGTDPAGASFLIDITYQDNTQQRFSLDFTKKGRSLIQNQWYVVRQVFAKETTVPVKSISGYVLGNWVGLGATSAKTIQVASVDCYRATEQDYLTQMWNITNTTTINGGNIATGSVTADKINVTDLFSRNITMSGKFVASSTGFVYPEVSDANLLASFIQGTATPTAYQKTIFDFDRNGTLNLLDWLNIRALVMRQKTIATVVAQTGYTPTNTQISVTIDPSNADKVISIAGTNSFGTAFERYFGASGMVTSNINAVNVNTDSINAATMNTSGDNISNYFIANNAKGFYCKDTGGTSRAIAFLGADNITYFAYDIGYTYDVIMGHRSNTNEIHLKARYWVRCGEDTQGFIPNSNGLTQLGLPSFRWSVVYAATGAINTSDRSMKKDIATIDDKYMAMLDLIIPSTFKMIDGTSGRTHAGWVADDVEAAMLKVGLSAIDFAGFCKDKIVERGVDADGKECDVPKLDENGIQVEQRGLRYEEFIPLLHEKIRRLEAKLIEHGIV